jgi:uncharacterized protein
VKGIADTGFLVAFANAADHHHAWAVRVATTIETPLVTCEAVLAETAFHLRDSRLVLDLVQEQLVQVGIDVESHVARLTTLGERYRDRRPDLADLCVVRLSEIHPRHHVVTVDEADFRVYRRNGRGAIPLICPPRR